MIDEKMTEPKSKWNLRNTIDAEDSAVPLAIQTFMTGLLNILIYNRSQTWVGFQTGNMVQFAGNIADYIYPGSERFALLTVLRIVSILSFTVGSFVGARTAEYLKAHKQRYWLVSSSFIQSILLWAAAGILLAHPGDWEPDWDTWPPIIMLCALSMGFQSVLAQKMGSPHFATTVAFTATLTQMASDKSFFKGFFFSKRPLALVALTVGAGIGQTCLLHPAAGLRAGVGLAAGMRFLQGLCWLLIPPKRPNNSNN